jgi:hypothetical protein
MGDNLVVRIDVVGHASRRWRGAKTPAEAESLNQKLSEARAQNIRKVVEAIVKTELPGIPIEVPARGVGSREGFPVVSEDNAAVDRSVVVTIDLTHVQNSSKVEQRPSRIYMPSKFWKLKVLSMIGASGIGARGTFLRVVIENRATGGQLKMSGYLFGGDLNPSPANLFNFDGGPKTNPNDFNKPVGDEVTFETDEAEDSDYWVGSENGQWVRIVHAKVGLVRKRETTFLQFTGLDTYQPGSLVFEYKKGWSLPSVDISVVSGKLQVEGPVPNDWVASTKLVTVPKVNVHHNYDGLLLSFPTEKSGLNDLTSDDQQLLTNFATNKSRAIRALAESGLTVTNPRP